MVKLTERANRVINIIKAKYGLKTKSDAINRLAKEYEELVLEPELRPEYVERLKRIRKEGKIRIKNIDSYFEKMQKS
ncbi:MAG: DUF2683 family protein [Candidatus Diapherotrites archaeon]|nr:DUF2683 family protein [Candidatus Diapherotrites archaeon]